MSSAAVVVDKLEKTFRKPFSGKKVQAVRGISFEVRKGEVFGFLGPNGAGKTTSIKMLTGLIFQTSGTARVLGETIPSAEAMRRVGFLPENPYVYPYLTPREFVTLCARLSGMSGRELPTRVAKIIDRVGMTEAIDRPVGALSKGMLQRVGLAAALVHDPDLLILDEPMSGLDPLGRKDVRDLMLEERARGKTVFFSTHILNDAETLCDRVCILRRGEVALEGTLHELLSGSSRSEVTFEGGEKLTAGLNAAGIQHERVGGVAVIQVEGDDQLHDLIALARQNGGKLVSVTPKRESLEELFVRRAV